LLKQTARHIIIQTRQWLSLPIIVKGRPDMTKTELLEALSAGSDLTKKQVGQVLDVLGEVIGTQLAKKGSGIFILPGLLKIARVTKPARKAGKKPNPFKPGEMMEVKARAAYNVVKVRPLKKLKEMV
jgi:nucleoid DNA-binding protein